MSRIVEVIGATVTSPRNSKAELLVKTRTGRFLSGRTDRVPGGWSQLESFD